ncbi:orotate phosphoribosyltransferase [Flavobacteriales bacterium]|jgi:orotate phosphoribosyltransferase|nr:orotate phosphoribosyltransferase [Flavobacteriales bacterium]
MLNSVNSEAKIAEFLLKIKAIKLQPENPFQWASGWNSPIYCDNRKTLSYPEIRTYIRDCFSNEITKNYSKPDIIAGVATGGIALGALVAQELELPFCYVRAQAKSHGLNNSIEGAIEAGQNVVVIEDLISSGKSSLNAVADLRKAGLNVVGMGAIFSYGFNIADDNFKNANCELFTLTNYSTLLDIALASNYISSDAITPLEEWRSSPSTWKK